MTIKLIPVSEEQILLERARSLEYAIDQAKRRVADLSKERWDIVEHCLRNGITKASDLRLVRRKGVACESPDAYRVERIDQE
jgi:hypothetical protein